ncbi:Gfo/Idh/MocA family oxidoreductase [Pseudovibrio sp. Ad26]|uniref:Gfo/Idh/MocA family protein n=1 Tax=Pseudovibrio sp. Ad26 TaxID=989410 RepID=UPI0007AEAE5F|nr:Gfo/Idh/MocA family oxidoreductase [Pseudovibrio sp. Ad26]KZL15296.1 1,5-anhydro-D-fructose reductase [Pseudovibrio sp. Ad26]
MTKLNWGLIGGGEGSQIGPAHRLGASVDGLFQLAAGALDADAAKGRMFAQSLGIAEDRAYGDWQEMLAAEKTRSDKVDLVTIATPNATHFEITKAFLEGGFHVLCEKPMTMTVKEGEEIVKISRQTGKKCAVNFGYSGFSLVRQMREMIAAGELGEVRLVKAEFAHGFHADAADADNPRVRWRYDPAAAGVSAVLADAGIHALHMACFVTGQEVSTVSADFASTIASRDLEDDAMINFRMNGGAVGRLWTSAVAVGRMHGLSLQVFGEKGGLAWQQEHPNQLHYTPLNGRTQIIERGAGDLYNAAQKASRVTIGHSEGMPLAFANIYCDLAEMIHADKAGGSSDGAAFLFPSSEDGLRSMASVYAAVKSAHASGAWQDAVPALLK